ncbi:hypothetical protein AVEN_161708-1 [Araneus ventricosus]|uniref:Uncharacterized protein n=1 Tax=Araneus ventricosus TaxID=182803 RepID=A0A4Y2UUM6_ARAVE|nr:hypothetical protein AVEN_161708-1 [Araneus ventricosus]
MDLTSRLDPKFRMKCFTSRRFEVMLDGFIRFARSKIPHESALKQVPEQMDSSSRDRKFRMKVLASGGSESLDSSLARSEVRESARRFES